MLRALLWKLWLQITLASVLVRCQVGYVVAPWQGVRPRITEVSAMCTAEGITAQIMFNQNFYGKIYSKNYATTHECVYYNGYDMNMILFSVPNYKCGTRIIKNNQNVIQSVENEVYVQFDKDTQTIDDKRYLFICEMSFAGDYRATIRPEQTIVVQTAEPTRVVVSGGGTRPDVSMEIQDGLGPNAPPLRRTLRLGETITLVIRANRPPTGVYVSARKDMDYGNNAFAILSLAINFDLSVHSCYATDGTGLNRADLTDRLGCTARPQVADSMRRVRGATQFISYMSVRTFKFPNSDDVYFTCTVEICGDCRFPEACSATNVGQIAKSKRELFDVEDTNTTASDKVELSEHVRIIDLEDNVQLVQENYQSSQAEKSSKIVCLVPGAFAAVLTSIVLLLILLVISTVQITIMRKKLAKRHSHSQGSGIYSMDSDCSAARSQ